MGSKFIEAMRRFSDDFIRKSTRIYYLQERVPKDALSYLLDFL